MRIATLASLIFFTAPFLADHRHVVSDDKVDFSTLKTFAIREGQATTTRPELNNNLIFKKVEEAIRSQLVTKGLKEAQDRPDVFVTFRLGEDRRSGPSTVFDKGTLVIEVTSTANKSLVWQGVYTDENSSPAKVAQKLPDDVKKLFSEYPPKKKK